MKLTILFIALLFVSCSPHSEANKKYYGNKFKIYPSYVQIIEKYGSFESEEIITNTIKIDNNLYANLNISMSSNIKPWIVEKPEKFTFAWFDGGLLEVKDCWLLFKFKISKRINKDSVLLNDLFLTITKDSIYLHYTASGSVELLGSLNIAYSLNQFNRWYDYRGKLNGSCGKFFDSDHLESYLDISNIEINGRSKTDSIFVGTKEYFIENVNRNRIARNLLFELNRALSINLNPTIWKPNSLDTEFIKNIHKKWCDDNQLNPQNIGIEIISNVTNLQIGNRLPIAKKEVVFLYNENNENRFYDILIGVSK